jgi:hypothetical protein
MAAVGEAGDLRWHLRNDMVVTQCVKARYVSARINFRQDVFGSHSLGWAIPPVRVSSDEPTPHQTAQLRIDRMQRGLRGVRKFGDGKTTFPCRARCSAKKSGDVVAANRAGLQAQVQAVASKLDELLALPLHCLRRQALRFHVRQDTA